MGQAVAPSSAYLRPLAGNSVTSVLPLARASISPGAGEVLLSSGDGQKEAFFVLRIPAPWLGHMAARAPVPGHALGTAAKE
eukprot:9289614-Pyramimonas_sp.AAC.1